MFEIFTVFLPVTQVIRFKILRRKAARSTAKWETDSQATLTVRTSISISTSTSTEHFEMSTATLAAEKGRCSSPTAELAELDPAMGDRLLSMAALDYTLTHNPRPLQEFSALNDFSGENIAFLTRMAAWKAPSWQGIPAGPVIREEGNTKEENAYQPHLNIFNQALNIYIDFISPHYAPFPLNVSSQALKKLQDVFEEPAVVTRGASEVNPAAPFDFPAPASGRLSSEQKEEATAYYTGSIPAGFSREIFDDVRDSVKYLVLTNTWPKYIAEMQQRQRQKHRRSADTERTITSAGSSQRTLVTRVSEKLQAIF
jgi:hypothetical protein